MLHRLILGGALLCALATAAHGETCRASYYGGGEYLNRHTASGARFDPAKLTAAHRTLPFGTRVRVSWHGRSVVVTVNDRGPAKWTGRCIDLAKAAAVKLDMIRAGVATVTINVLKRGSQ
jgi:rare lipoprotein A